MSEDSPEKNKILSRLDNPDFVGRSSEFDRVVSHLSGATAGHGLLILAEPGIGLTELLCQVYDGIFQANGDVIPVYFDFRASEIDGEKIALRFLQAFLLQTIAFRRNDSRLLDLAPEICELTELANPSDAEWIAPLVEACETNSKLKDKRSFIRLALSAPLRAAGRGLRIGLMFDNFHRIAAVAGEENLLDEFKDIYNRANVPFVMGCRRRFMLGALQVTDPKLAGLKDVHLSRLTQTDARILAEKLAERYSIIINDQTKDLIAQQFSGNPSQMMALFEGASKRGQHLDSFQQIEQEYVEELFAGRIGKSFDAIFAEVSPNTSMRRKIISLLHDSLENERRNIPVEAWRKRLNCSDVEFNHIIGTLNINEVIRLTSGMIQPQGENLVLGAYINAAHRLEILAEARAQVVGETLSEALKQAPLTMAGFYRRLRSLGLREILSVFDCQSVPLSLLDYRRFEQSYKGAEDVEVIASLSDESDRFDLPQIIYAANCAGFYPQISQVSDEDRCAVALGFEGANYTDDDEVVWLAAEIDSKLPAAADLTEFWCDRLEMVALMCNFARYRLWLIAPEGFSEEALDVLDQREAFGSSRRQVELLVTHLNAEELIQEKLGLNEYEMIIPMGDDTEIIAAHAVEEIARRHEFDAKSINQIKTALVEACINANEHGMSPDQKIYQKFKIEPDRLEITVSNRGIKLYDKKAGTSTKIEPSEGRRGWGLKLIRSLMDDVSFEQVDDGTRISMTKYLKK